MFYFKKIIRYILAIGGVLVILGTCIETFHWYLLGFFIWPYLVFMVVFDCPAMLLLPIVSVCNYFITRKFLSEFRREYYFWFARLGLYVLFILAGLIAEHLK